MKQNPNQNANKMPYEKGKTAKKGHSKRHKAPMTVITAIVVVCLIVLIALAVFIKVKVLPSVGDINLSGLDLSSIVYYTDENGQVKQLEQLHGNENRLWADLSEIPENLKNAVIAIEDERFRKHHGVDWKRTIGATFGYITHSSRYGGSTITQQLIKNITGDDDYSVKRKVIEILRALELEKKYSKDQILEYYLNTIGLGNGLNGVKTAAQVYFGKDLSELSLAECASIAGITQYPVKYDPLTHPENNKERQETVLWQMRKLGMITDDQYEQAKAEKLVFTNSKIKQQQTSAQSYYVDQVVEDVIEALQKEKGYTKSYASQLLYSGGLQIYAAIDINVQKAMDEVFSNPANFPSVKGSVEPQSAMVIIDPYTGAVKGIVGGIGEKTASRTFNRATDALRQPGSAIKPISVYAPAIEYGWVTSGSVFDDKPVNAGNGTIKNYYSGYRGLMTVKDAVEQSVNTVPVQILMNTPGATKAAFDFAANNLGVTSLVRSEKINGKTYSDVAVAPLALGGLTKGVSVMELTAAYAPFVNKGIYNEPYTFTKVLDHDGNVLLERQSNSTVAMKEETAYIMNKLLQNVAQNGTGRPARFSSSMPMGGKTGTTSDDKDRWFVGFTPYYVGAVWYGYDQPKGLPSFSTNPAAKAWKLVMAKVHKNLSGKSFSACNNVVQVTVCRDSGKLPGANCALDPRGSRLETVWYIKGTEPTETCDRHVLVNIDITTGQYATQYCPSQYLKKVALVNFKREFPKGGRTIYIEDAQYMFVPFEGIAEIYVDETLPVYMNVLTPGTYPGISPKPKSGRYMNTLSTAFRSPPAIGSPTTETPPGSDTSQGNTPSNNGGKDQSESPSSNNGGKDQSGTSTSSGGSSENKDEPPGWWTWDQLPANQN